MAMKLYSNGFSPNARKVLAVAEQLGTKLEIVNVDLRAGENRKPEFLAINPMGRVPALVDGALKLSESNAIISYLAGKQDTTLWPKSEDRYSILQWMNWEASHYSDAVRGLIGEYIFKPMRGGTPDPGVVDRKLAQFDKGTRVLDAQLEGKKWLLGDTLTLADFSVGVWLGYRDICKLPIDSHPNVKRWYASLLELPAGKLLPPTM